jgi:hypothetical protein
MKVRLDQGQAAAEEVADRLARSSGDERAILHDQLWLAFVFTEYRRRARMSAPERQRFTVRANVVLAALDPKGEADGQS